jgi:hypothetical protein
LLLGTLLAAAACSSEPGPVASINGTDITVEQLAALHVGDLAELTPQEEAGSVLLLLLHDGFLAAAADDFGIVPEPERVAEQITVRTARFGDGAAVDAALTRQGITRLRVELEAELDVLRDAVGEELVQREVPGFDIDAAYRSYVMGEGTVCVRHIQLLGADGLDEAVARLDGGEDFGDVAAELSADFTASRPAGEPGSGGDLGCGAPGNHPPGFSDATLDAPVGEVYGPVFTSATVHLIVVYERDLPALAEVRAAVLDHAGPLQGPDLFRDWGVGVLRDATVEVASRYGSWGPLPETNGVPTVIPTDR